MLKLNFKKELLSRKGKFDIDISLTAQEGDFISIYGSSGAGKTTLLRFIAGLDTQAKGQITVKGKVWFDSNKKINITPQKREVGMVFQDYALFPHLTVRENLEFALVKKQSKSIIEEFIDIVELKEVENRKPNTLSGGQKQRVALARALVKKPKILLLDEPFSALDDNMRQKLQDYILKIHKKYGLTTFLVSHDLPEVFKLSNKVMKIKDGKIVIQGTPEEIFLNRKISGKYNTTGIIVSIKKADILNIVSVLSNSNIVQVVVSNEEQNSLSIGQKVMLVSKSFNPILIPID